MAQQPSEIEGFTIIRRLGTGARSVIYMAVDETTKETIALKRAVFESPEDVRIFEQMATEYHVARQLDHPYLRRCYKLIKKRKFLRIQELLLTMELFDGQSLEEQEKLSLGDVLLVFRMVATALNAFHQKGYVHCDIKPNNILFNKNGTIKIIDFGQSCKIGHIKKRIQGTPEYIAPEQVRREHLSHRTDIFNLGATMYWALTGRHVPTLIQRTNVYGLSVAEPLNFRAPHEIYKRIPVELSEMIMHCVQDKPSDRPSNMSELIACLDVMIRDVFQSRLTANAATGNPTIPQGG
jgi:eukaryotic-like serine/threonine-protein kinase